MGLQSSMSQLGLGGKAPAKVVDVPFGELLSSLLNPVPPPCLASPPVPPPPPSLSPSPSPSPSPPFLPFLSQLPPAIIRTIDRLRYHTPPLFELEQYNLSSSLSGGRLDVHLRSSLLRLCGSGKGVRFSTSDIRDLEAGGKAMDASFRCVETAFHKLGVRGKKLRVETELCDVAKALGEARDKRNTIEVPTSFGGVEVDEETIFNFHTFITLIREYLRVYEETSKLVLFKRAEYLKALEKGEVYEMEVSTAVAQ